MIRKFNKNIKKPTKEDEDRLLKIFRQVPDLYKDSVIAYMYGLINSKTK